MVRTENMPSSTRLLRRQLNENLNAQKKRSSSISNKTNKPANRNVIELIMFFNLYFYCKMNTPI